VELDPKFKEARLNLALIFRESGDLDRAEREFQTLVDLYPEDPMRYIDLGTLYQKKELLEKAIACYTRARDLRPEWATPY
jgi:tetratricopeptide (TPR) repeat protein